MKGLVCECRNAIRLTVTAGFLRFSRVLMLLRGLLPRT